MPPLGTAPRRVSPGVWKTRTGRSLPPASSAIWEHYYRTGRTDGQGHMRVPSVVQSAPLPKQPPSPKATQATAPPKKPGFDTVLVASKGDKTAQAQVRRYARQQQQKRGFQAEAQTATDQKLFGQALPAVYASADATRLNPSAEALFKSLSPSEWAKTAYQHAQHGDIAGLGLDAAMFFPFGRAARGAKAALAVKTAEDAAKTAEVAGTLTPARRSLTVGELTTQFPGARSRVTRNLIEKPADAFSIAHPGLPLAGAEARIAKQAGRIRATRESRVQAQMANHLKNLPAEGSPEDVAHFYWAQLPKSHRNIEGLALIREKRAAELRRVTSGEAQAELEARVADYDAKMKAWRGNGAPYKLIQARQDALYQISDLPHVADDLAASIAQLDHTIKAAPQLNQKTLDAVRALSESRQATFEASGHLNPHQAGERKGLLARWLGTTPTGEEAYIGHRLDTVRGGTRQGLPASPGVGRPRLPQGITQRNRSILITQGRERPSVHVAREDWQAAETYRNAVGARDDLAKIGTPYKGGRIGADQMLVNAKGKVVPAQWKGEDRLSRLISEGADEQELRSAVEDIYKGMFVDAKDAEAFVESAHAAGVDLSGLRVVNRKTVERYYSQFTRAPVGNRGFKAYDAAVDFAVANIVFIRPGYIPKNVLQNLIMAVPHQGPRFPFNATRAGQILADPQLRPLAMNEVGYSGATGGLAAEADLGKKLRGVPGKAARVATDIADVPLRISALVHEAANEGVIPKLGVFLSEKDKAAFLDWFTNPAREASLNDARWRAVDAMADFTRMTPKQRQIARRFLIIPGWLVAGSRYPIHFAATHPGRALALAYIAAGEPGSPHKFNKSIDEYFIKGLPSWVQGLPYGDKVFRTSSINPASTPWEIAKSASQRDVRTVGDYLQPLPTTLYDVANRRISGPHGSYPASLLDSLRAGGERLAPTAKFIEDLISPPNQPRTYPEDTSRWGRIKREVGVVPIKVNKEKPKGKKGKAKKRGGTYTPSWERKPKGQFTPSWERK